MTFPHDHALDRRAFVAELVAGVPDALFISGLGSPTYDLFAAGDRERNFYLWGAMGAAAPMGLGLALARPEESVVVLTGDGEQLMGIGSLATIAVKRPPNLAIVVLDNGHYGETGMQQSHTSLGTDLAGTARAMGIADTLVIDSHRPADDLIQRIRARRKTTFAQVRVRAEASPRVMPARDGTFIKNRFRAALGLAPF